MKEYKGYKFYFCNSTDSNDVNAIFEKDNIFYYVGYGNKSRAPEADYFLRFMPMINDVVDLSNEYCENCIKLVKNPNTNIMHDYFKDECLEWLSDSKNNNIEYTNIKLNEIININSCDYNSWTICLNNANDEGIYTFSGDEKSSKRLKEHISWKQSKDKEKSFRNIDTTKCLQFQRLDREKKYDEWLFLGAYKVNGYSTNKDGNTTYNLEMLDDYSSFIERLIIKYKKHQGDKQAKIPTNLIESIEVVKILEKKYVESDIDFPGYDKVCCSFKELSEIINNNVSNWKNYLSKAQCVYVVTDISNEKIYVGSTYGSDGIWQRWSKYVKTKGTGGNKELDKLIKSDPDYAYKNFQFSILECFLNKDGNEQFILDRETYWKNVLKSKDFGYNKN